MDSGEKYEYALAADVPPFGNQSAGDRGLDQLADSLKLKTATKMAEVLLADDQLLSELLGS